MRKRQFFKRRKPDSVNSVECKFFVTVYNWNKIKNIYILQHVTWLADKAG